MALLFLCHQHVEDDPFFEGVQSARFLVPFGHHRIVQLCHRGHFALDLQCSATNVGAFQLKLSVDQDLSVIVAEAIDDDVVKQRIVPIVFPRE